MSQNGIGRISLKTGTGATAAYLGRLYEILKYGLWMTEEVEYKLGGVTIPATPKCCFTELKLSQSKCMPRRYGRLELA